MKKVICVIYIVLIVIIDLIAAWIIKGTTPYEVGLMLDMKQHVSDHCDSDDATYDYITCNYIVVE